MVTFMLMFVSTLLHFLDICWGRFDLQHSSKQFINRIQCTCRSLSADCRGLVAAASPAIPKSDHRSTWLRLAGLEGTTAQTLPGFCRYSVQAVEALRLQLPRGLAAALLCLRQLRLHHAVLAKDRERATKAQAGWHLAHCASFARLTVAQISEPDFAAALSKSGASRRIPALAVVVQLERCIQSQGEEAETLLEVGRLRLMQAQASQQGAITDDEGGHEVRFFRFTPNLEAYEVPTLKVALSLFQLQEFLGISDLSRLFSGVWDGLGLGALGFGCSVQGSGFGIPGHRELARKLCGFRNRDRPVPDALEPFFP